MPTILQGLGYTAVRAQVMSIPVYMVAFVTTIIAAQASDRLQHRFIFVLVAALLQTIGYALLLAPTVTDGVKYLALFLSAMGFYPGMLMVITWTNNNFAGHYKRSIASGMASGISNAGGFIAPNTFPTSAAPGFVLGYSITLGMVVMLGVLAVVFAVLLGMGNGQRKAGKQNRKLEREDRDNLGDANPAFRYTF